MTRGSRGVHDFDGIPQLPGVVLRKANSSLHDRIKPEPTEEEIEEADQRMAEIAAAIKHRMAANFGGTWASDLS